MLQVFQITWLKMKERKEIRSDFRADLQKAYNHCIAWDGLWAAISQEPSVKLLQWYNGEFLAQKVRVLILSEVLAPFDLNKGLRQRDREIHGSLQADPYSFTEWFWETNVIAVSGQACSYFFYMLTLLK